MERSCSNCIHNSVCFILHRDLYGHMKGIATLGVWRDVNDVRKENGEPPIEKEPYTSDVVWKELEGLIGKHCKYHFMEI